VLPGAQAILFTVWSSASAADGIESAEIVARVLSSGETRKIIAGAAPIYAASGHLLFTRADGLWAVPFSPTLLAATGLAVRVLDGIVIDATGAPQLALSANGTLVYEPGGLGGVANLRTLTWVNRDGVEQAVRVPPRAYLFARISPDGSRIALDARDEQFDVWIWDIARSTLTRLTFDPRQNISPLWTPDSERIIYAGEAGGRRPRSLLAGCRWRRLLRAADITASAGQPYRDDS
jgi:serine/threonine-protein kinase